jgi:hypothetical protein
VSLMVDRTTKTKDLERYQVRCLSYSAKFNREWDQVKQISGIGYWTATGWGEGTPRGSSGNIQTTGRKGRSQTVLLNLRLVEKVARGWA